MSEHPIHDFDRLIRRQRLLLKLIGLDSYDPTFRPRITIMVVCLSLIFVAISMYDLYIFRNDLFNFVYVLITIFFASIGIGHICVFVCYRDVLPMMLEQSYDTYRLVGKDERELHILQWYTKLFKRGANVYSLMFIGTSILTGLLPIAIYQLTGERVLPYGVVLPFVDPDSQVGYELNYMYQVSCIIWTPPGLVGAQCMMFGVVLNICVQYDILGVKLHDLDKLIRSGEESAQREELIGKKLRVILRDQQRLISFISHVEEANTVMAGVEILSFGLQIVITLYVLQLAFWFPGYVIIVLATMQLFILCLLGTIIEYKGEKFSEAVYQLTWNELSRGHKKIFRLLLLSSQQPYILTWSGMTNINMNLFVGMSQKFYSIFMMLRNM
uniref:Uncharacterized protein n=1 Tax=Anopheles epiroticus TaxID=199890 RepID=A0A182PN49_9DIPT